MTRCFRAYWAEEETWFYFEADTDGWITRQVELQGPLEKPIAAASLAEAAVAEQAGALSEYETTFGFTATVPVHEWDEHDPHDLSPAEFEAVWATAQAVCEAKARRRSTPES